MPLHIVRNDLIKMKVDAIVNATDCALSGSGGADRCIHQAAGPRLRAACDALGGCEVGQARLTEAYELPCRYIVHTVGPHWLDGAHGESEQLAACYHNALELAQAHGWETVAFPLIASGVNGYPKELALQTAVESIRAFLEQADMTVYLVVFDRAAYRISSRLHDEVTAYISDCYADAHTDFRARIEDVRAGVNMEQHSCFCGSGRSDCWLRADAAGGYAETARRELLRDAAA